MNKVNKKSVLLATTVLVLVASPTVFADAQTAVTDAITSGQSLVGAIAPGVIGIAAIMLGVGIAVSWLRK